MSSQIPDSGQAADESDDINWSASNNDELQATVEIVIQAAGDEITAEDIEDTDLASANENENVNEVIAELVENSPPEPEPLSLAEQMVADYEAQQAEIAAADAAAQAAAEAAPPKWLMFIYGIPRIAKLTLVKEKQVNLLWIPEQPICLR